MGKGRQYLFNLQNLQKKVINLNTFFAILNISSCLLSQKKCCKKISYFFAKDNCELVVVKQHE